MGSAALGPGRRQPFVHMACVLGLSRLAQNRLTERTRSEQFRLLVKPLCLLG